MDVTSIVVEYEGPPAMVELFAAMAEDVDFEVGYNPPVEMKSIEGTVATVMLTLTTAKVGDAAIDQARAVIGRFLLRRRIAKLEIVDDGTSPGTEG